MAEANFDWKVSATFGTEASNIRSVTFQLVVSGGVGAAAQGFYWWLADTVAGSVTGTSPSTISILTSNAWLHSLVASKAYLFKTLSSTGQASVNIGYNGAQTWVLNVVANMGNIEAFELAFA